jgi:hypothetical protein
MTKAPLPDTFDPLPEVKELAPMTARQFRRMSSMLAVAVPINRRDAGKEPLPAFHPIARSALPRLPSLERK